MKALVDQYQRTLVSFFMRRSRNTWDAEELTKEVFCKIWKRRDIALSEYSDAYMFTIAWSVLRDRLRREKVRHHDMHIEYDEDLARVDVITPQDIVRGEEFYEYYLRLLESLTRVCESRMQTAPVEELLEITKQAVDGNYEALQKLFEDQYSRSLMLLPHVIRQRILPTITVVEETLLSSLD